MDALDYRGTERGGGAVAILGGDGEPLALQSVKGGGECAVKCEEIGGIGAHSLFFSAGNACLKKYFDAVGIDLYIL